MANKFTVTMLNSEPAEDYQGNFASPVSMTATRHMSFDVDNVPATARITRQPNNGVARLRSDGKLQVDLTGSDSTANELVQFEVGGTTYDLNINVSATADGKNDISAWGPGLHYYPEIDSNDAVVVEPTANTKIVRIAQSGNSRAQVATLAGVSEATVTNAWLSSRPEYHTASDPLNESVGKSFAEYLYDNGFHVHVLYKRGDTFTQRVAGADSDGFDRYLGPHTPLHPTLVGAYGTGARPRFTNKSSWEVVRQCANIVLQSLHISCNIRFAQSFNFVCDDIKQTGTSGYGFTPEGSNRMNRGITIRRWQAYDISKSGPSGTNWDNQGDRISGSYTDECLGILYEKCVQDMVGWEEGYFVDGRGSGPKPPDNRGHGSYDQKTNSDVTHRDQFLLRSSHSAIQLRAGGVVERCFFAGYNTGLSPVGKGWDAAAEGTVGNWAYVTDVVQTYPGQKYSDIIPDLVLAGGMSVQGVDSVLDRVIFCHYEQGETVTGGGQRGPVGNANSSSQTFTVKFKNGGTLYPASDWKAYNCKVAFNPNTNIGGLDTGVLDVTKIGQFVDEYWTRTGTAAKNWYPQLQDLATQIRGEDKPWDVLPDLLAFFQNPFGYGQAPRTVAQTVSFLPRADGASPGFRADIRDDWSTGDLPGTVDGDDVDVSNYAITWNISPENRINTLSFAPGGAIRLTGGALMPAGSVITGAGGNTITAENGGKVGIPGFDDTNKLTLKATDARISNTGAVTGPVDVEAMAASEVLFGSGDGDSWDVGDGTITLHGGVKAGFDGENGDAMSLTFGANSVLNMKSAATVAVDNLATATPPIESGVHEMWPVEGASYNIGGRNAKLASWRYFNDGDVKFQLKMYDLSGALSNNSTVSGPRTRSGLMTGSSGSIGTVNGTPTYELPKIDKFTSGIFGTSAPDVATTITLGGTLNIDVTGMAPGTYDLITADTLLGSFDTINITGGSGSVALVENPLRVTIV